jgi:hypothetical protein
MLFMVVEHFKDGKANLVYERYRQKGRMLPEGLSYKESWVESNFGRCFQLMECGDPRLFHQWVKEWEDLVEFEVIPVLSSQEAAETISQMGQA